MEIPTIEISKEELKEEWDKTKFQVLEALEEHGCFIAVYNNVPHETREAMFDASKQVLCDFPLETKLHNSSTEPFQAYIGQIPQLPLYESLCISNVHKPRNVENFANNFWPQGNPHFCDVVKSYSNHVKELDETVKKMVLESLGLKDYSDEFMEAIDIHLRISHYKAAQGEIGLAPHTDPHFLTILSQNKTNGLQILNKNGEWIDVKLSPNSYIVIAGESFMAWTNGRLTPVVHRVTMNEDSDRFSILFNSVPKPGYIIKAPKEVVDEHHPLLFKPYEFLQFMKFHASENGTSAGPGNILKAYCAV